MKNFKINYNYTGFNNELVSIRIGGNLYTLDDLSFEAKELLTAMTYEDYQLSIEYFDSIAQMIGYDNTLQGIQDLMALGANIATASIYRELVMNSYKNKYKGLWR
jgi:hypothetical protein